MPAKMTAGALIERLRASLVKPGDSMPGGMFMTEVTLENRRIDGLYCGFFGSRGRFLRGYEVKVARSDWLAELDQPAKAEVWEQNVHEWWIVAPDTEVVRPEELPDGWGLLIPDPNPRTKTRMLTVVKAKRHEDRNPSWAATHAIIQKADTERARATGEAVRREQARHREQLEAEVKRRLEMDSGTGEHWRRERDAAHALVQEISDILGIRIVEGNWSYEGAVTVQELREQFGRYLIGGRQVEEALRRRLQTVRSLAESVADAERALKELGVK